MYILDTNALIGTLFNPDFLSVTARKVIETDNDLYVSIASLWEISIKQSIGKLDIDASPIDISSTCEEMDIHMLPISPQHLSLIQKLPDIHRDPFDRLIIAQATYEGAVIITKDSIMPKYEVKTIW